MAKPTQSTARQLESYHIWLRASLRWYPSFAFQMPLSKVLTQNLHNIKAIYVTDVSILSNLCICLSDAPVMNNKRQKLGEGWTGWDRVGGKTEIATRLGEGEREREGWGGETEIATRWLSSSSFSSFSGRTWPCGNGTGVAFSSRSSGLSSSLSFSSWLGWEGSRNSTMSVSVPNDMYLQIHTHAQATLRRKWIFVFVIFFMFYFSCTSGNFEEKAMPSAGILPFVQTFICTFNNTCHR